jgi:hypothetical protein
VIAGDSWSIRHSFLPVAVAEAEPDAFLIATGKL